MPLSIREHVPLRDMTTFRIGGPARYFCTVTDEAELAEAVAWARGGRGENGNSPVSFFVLGGGSNILVGDAGFDGLVIKMEIRGIQYDSDGQSTDGIIRTTAGAGENWDDFVGTCTGRGLAGLENLSGIPGTVGAAPVQNIGAYGADVSQTISSVRVFDTQADVATGKGKFADISNSDCHFYYRDSMFKHEKNKNGMSRYIITSVTFNLRNYDAVAGAKKTSPDISYKDLQEYFAHAGNAIKNDEITLYDVRRAVLAIRSAKLPDVRTIGTAGSFFKNPIISLELFAQLKEKYPELPSYPVLSASSGDSIKVPLAWILDHVCGYKGAKKGNVGTYENQALVIVNDFVDGAGATAEEIKSFAAEITAAVKEKTGIDIEPEVQYVGA